MMNKYTWQLSKESVHKYTWQLSKESVQWKDCKLPSRQRWQFPIHNATQNALLEIDVNVYNFENCYFSIVGSL